ncbi:MAG: hypothetical protein EP330_10150 [Deltaproteobacteria bacterium]|nr:MAG: hypothetical protein EP330_10150 [Deltaproteobacteria bacterium]
MTTWPAVPRMGPAYARALFSRKRPRPPFALPESEARLGPLTLDESALAAYREVCGADMAVPASYPQLLVTPVHVHLLTARAFPFPAMGLVHPRCVVRQHAPLAVGDEIRIDARIEDLRDVDTGVEFDLVAEVHRDGECVWESRAATYFRTRKREGEKQEPPAPELASQRDFAVPRDAGRRYARVSGDANPVHLHPLLSRLFGYKQPIAHGWWLLARVIGELAPADGPMTLDLDLRRPVFLGETLRFGTSEDGPRTRFAITDERGKVRLTGTLDRS